MTDHNNAAPSKAAVQHIEESAMSSAATDDLNKTSATHQAGTVRLLVSNETVLIPTPSPDPKDPLNLPIWRKWAILLILSIFGSTAVILASGMGAIITNVRHSYPPEDAERTNDLLTYPTLFMGLGNLISMPLALTIGRRPVFLVTMILLVASGIGCAFAPNLSAHIAFRNIMSLAAGQSEALCPMIVQEIYFLHERGRMIGWFVTIQNVVSGVFFITSTYLVEASGWRWWYGSYTIINAAVLVITYFLFTETYYDRPEDATEGAVHLDFNDKGELDAEGQHHRVIRVTTAQNHVLEPERFGPRTWKQDLKIFSVKPNWSTMGAFYMDLMRGLAIPTMFWLFLLNGAFLGLYIITTGTFAGVLLSPPYLWSFTNLGYCFVSQIVVTLLFLPLLGYGNDFVIKLMSKMHGGIYKPEYRLINMAIPTIVTVVSGVIYGQAAAHPTNYDWAAIVVPFGGIFFGFLGANIVGITYAVDAFPLKTGPYLVLICAGRGIVSFGLSYSVLPAVSKLGYDGTMNIQTGIAGGLGLLTIPMYFLGPRIRVMAVRWLKTGPSV